MSHCYRCGAPLSFTSLCGACRLADDQRSRHREQVRQQEDLARQQAKEQRKLAKQQQELAQQQANYAEAARRMAAQQYGLGGPSFGATPAPGHGFAPQGAKLGCGGAAVIALCIAFSFATAGDKKDSKARDAAKAAKAEEDKKKAEEARRVAVDEARVRLAQRDFITLTPQALKASLVSKQNPKGYWAMQYGGKYVRWDGKFDRTGWTVRVIAVTSESTKAACKDFNPTQEDDALGLATLAHWAPISIEGRLDEFEAGENGKYEFVLTDCVAIRASASDAGTKRP